MNQQIPESDPETTGGTVEAAKTEALKLKDAVQGEAAQTGEKIKEEAKAAVNHLQDAGKRFAVSQKEALSQKTDELAQAVSAASQKLGDGDEPNLLAGPAKSAAEQLTRLSTYLKDSDPQEILQGLGQMARRKPELVFGGLFLAGLLTARFLKASGKTVTAGTSNPGRPSLPPAAAPSYYSLNP